jgi:hypothetical protein
MFGLLKNLTKQCFSVFWGKILEGEQEFCLKQRSKKISIQPVP